MRRPYGLLIAFAATCTAIGVVLGPEAFAENLLAELAGIAIGAVVALGIVDRLTAERKRNEWARVRQVTLTGLCNCIEDLAMDFYLAEPAPRSTDLDFLRDLTGASFSAAAASMDALADRHIRNSDNARSEPPFTDWSSSRTLYSEAAGSLRTIREVFTPRIMQVAEEPKLIESLSGLEARERDWRIALYNIEGWGAPDTLGWDAAADTLKAAAHIYREIAELSGGSRSTP